MSFAFNIPFGVEKYSPYDAKVEYLESTGTQWIDTGVVFGHDIGFDVDFSYVGAGDPSGLGFKVKILGAADAEASVPHYDLNLRNGNITLWNGGTFVAISNTLIERSTRYVVKFLNNSGLVNGTPFTVSSNDRRNGGGNTAYLFAINVRGASFNKTSGIRMYSVRLYNDSSEILSLIPVRKDGVGYMYDSVSKQLFANSGTGDFIIGPDMN